MARRPFFVSYMRLYPTVDNLKVHDLKLPDGSRMGFLFCSAHCLDKAHMIIYLVYLTLRSGSDKKINILNVILAQLLKTHNCMIVFLLDCLLVRLCLLFNLSVHIFNSGLLRVKTVLYRGFFLAQRLFC